MIGNTISHFQILEKLGSGGMGIVYKAIDLKLERLVALKFLPPAWSQDPEAKQRFIHEAKSASALQHPNICTIHEIDETEDGQLFIAMDYYEGKTLKQIIDERELHLDEVLDILNQIASGLKNAHAQAIVHRDIKPANIFVTSDGYVKILDFGLAKFSGQTQLTRESSTVGTINYMSPEQARGDDIDHRSDIWSLGIVMYELITKKPPFRGEYDQAVIYSIVHEEPESILKIIPSIPAKMNTIVNRCIKKNPDDRYQNTDDLLKDLADAQKTEPADNKEAVIAFLNKYKKPFMAIGVVLILILALWIIPFGEHLDTQVYGKDAVQQKKSIAVLYFENLSTQAEGEVLCAGFTDGVITSLTKLGKLSVKSRSDVLPFKNKKKNINTIGQDLDVGFILQGSLQIAGDDLRVHVNLMDIHQNRYIWTDQFNITRETLLAVQDRISQKVATELGIKLNTVESDILAVQPTKDSRAFKWGSQGIYYKDRGMSDLALVAFDSALHYDPDYAQIRYYKGQIYQDKHEYDLAIQSYQLALPRVSKFQRILWQWETSETENLIWKMNLYEFGKRKDDLIFGVQPNIPNNTTRILGFDVIKKQVIWSQDLPIAVYYPFLMKYHLQRFYASNLPYASSTSDPVQIFIIDALSGEILERKIVPGIESDIKGVMWLYGEENQIKYNTDLPPQFPVMINLISENNVTIFDVLHSADSLKLVFEYQTGAFDYPMYWLLSGEPGKLSILIHWLNTNFKLIDYLENITLWESTENGLPLIEVDGKTIYLARKDSTELSAIDASTGKTKWTIIAESGITALRLVEKENMLIYSQLNGKICALKLEKSIFDLSRIDWELEIEEPVVKIYCNTNNGNTYLPRIYAVSENGNFATIDISKGTVISKTITGTQDFYIFMDNGYVFGVAPKKIFMIDNYNGKIRWIAHSLSSVFDARGIIQNKLITSQEHLVSAYDLEYGDLIWQYRTKTLYPSVHIIKEQGTLFVGDENNLVQLNTETNPENKIVEEKKVLVEMAHCLSAQGKHRAAIDVLDQVINKIDPGFAPAYLEMANIYKALDDKDKEVQFLIRYNDFISPRSLELSWLNNRLKECSNLLWKIEPPSPGLKYVLEIDSLLYTSGWHLGKDISFSVINSKNGVVKWKKDFYQAARIWRNSYDNQYLYLGVKEATTRRFYAPLNTIVALDKVTGNIHWSHKIVTVDEADITSIRVRNNIIYVYGESHENLFLNVYNSANGTLLWQKKNIGGERRGFVLANDKVAIALKDSILSIDAVSGQTEWIYALDSSKSIMELYHEPIKENCIVFTTTDKYYTCLNLENQQPVWQIQSPSESPGYEPVVEIAFGDTIIDWDAYSIFSFAPDLNYPGQTRLIFYTRIVEEIQYIISNDEKYIYLKTEDNKLIKLDRFTGEILEKIQLLWESERRGILIFDQKIFCASDLAIYAMHMD